MPARLLATAQRVALAAVLLAPLAARTVRAQTPAPRKPASQVVAVLPLHVAARDTVLAPLGFALADFLSTDLARSQQLTLVERARLGAILRELALAASGLVDSATAPRAGRLLQARTLVTGALTRRVDGDIVFDARLTDTPTGRVTSGLSGRATLANVLDAEKALVLRLFEQLGVQLTPRERALVEERPTRNLSALLAYGQGVQAEVNGQYALASRAFRRAAAVDPGFRQALVRADAARAQAVRASGTALDRINRPLELTPSTLRPGLAVDPAFGSAQSEITITIITP